MKKNQENQKQKKYLRRKKKLDLPGKKPLKIQKLMINGPTILEFLLVITLVESWSSRKVFLLIAPHAMRKFQLEDSRSTHGACWRLKQDLLNEKK